MSASEVTGEPGEPPAGWSRDPEHSNRLTSVAGAEITVFGDMVRVDTEDAVPLAAITWIVDALGPAKPTAKAWTPEQGDRAEGRPHVARGPNGERVEFGGFAADFAGDLWQRCRGYCAGRNAAEGASLGPIRECLAELESLAPKAEDAPHPVPVIAAFVLGGETARGHDIKRLASAIERAEGVPARVRRHPNGYDCRRLACPECSPGSES